MGEIAATAPCGEILSVLLHHRATEDTIAGHRSADGYADIVPHLGNGLSLRQVAGPVFEDTFGCSKATSTDHAHHVRNRCREMASFTIAGNGDACRVDTIILRVFLNVSDGTIHHLDQVRHRVRLFVSFEILDPAVVNAADDVTAAAPGLTHENWR